MRDKMIIAVLVLIILFIGYWSMNQLASRKSIYEQNLAALTDSIEYWTNRHGKVIAEKKTLLLGERDLLATIKNLDTDNLGLRAQLRKFKKQKTIIVSHTEFLLDTIALYLDPMGGFKKTTQWYNIAGRVSDSLRLDRIQFFNKQSVIFGQKSQGLFKPSLMTAQITNSNPYLKVLDLKSFSMPVKTKKFHLGLQAGYGITPQFTSTFYLGLGVSYSLLNF